MKEIPLKQLQRNTVPNLWDLFAFLVVMGMILVFAWAAGKMSTPYVIGDPTPISLAVTELPGYAVSTVLRMFIAMICSLVFTVIFGSLAAKNRQAEQIIIPFIDVMQSVPVLGILSISVIAFIRLFPDSLLGPECAAIFAIFTSQVWNITLSFYQSLKTLPKEIEEAARLFRLSTWQRFWKIEVPYAMPGLLWNMMVSMSAAWFFVVASEAIYVSNHEITLPGVGSYIAKAIDTANYPAIGYAILTMFLVILLYDQLLFRPIISWAEKFKPVSHFDEEHAPESWVLNVLQRTKIVRHFSALFQRASQWFISPRFMHRLHFKGPDLSARAKLVLSKTTIMLWNTLVVMSLCISVYMLMEFILKEVNMHEIMEVLYLGAITAFKVFILIFLSSLVWVPVGVWLGLRPKIAHFCQPIIQFLAAFPANLLFPVVVIGIIRFKLNVEVWTTPLMILGTQWYILFNIIAGTSALPKELIQAAKNFGVTKWLWWKRLILPAIFPYYITGAMTAAGGCWNASILADVVRWGDIKLTATGLGGYITEFTTVGDFPRIALGIGMMCFYVILFNRILWLPLYDRATTRYTIH